MHAVWNVCPHIVIDAASVASSSRQMLQVCASPAAPASSPLAARIASSKYRTLAAARMARSSSAAVNAPAPGPALVASTASALASSAFRRRSSRSTDDSSVSAASAENWVHARSKRWAL